MFLLEHIWIIPALTASSFVLILFFGKRLPFGGSEIGLAAVGLSLLLSIVAAGAWIARPATVEVRHQGAAEAAAAHGEAATGEASRAEAAPREASAGEAEQPEAKRASIQREYHWFSNGTGKGATTIRFGFLVDGLTIGVLFVVSLISFLVHVFSTNYMEGDVRFTYFFAALSLFTTGMFVLVTASNTLQMIFGWELMGLCSFMLIGHWWEEQQNSRAAMKAFFTTRTGDIGLLVGVVTLFFGAGQTFNVGRINAAAVNGDIRRAVLVAGAASLLVAVIGKSGQFPLHTWLPDAMAGPTPVSALLHAATMVVAGVFLVARLYPTFFSAFDIGANDGFNVLALVGGVTLIIAALLAFVQSDIKKVLAYSTVSQLGYMIMALGVGAWTAGVFHLFTHAFFKALLFLGAGSVSHAVHSFDMKKDMGGMRRSMPTTFVTFIIGSLALAGLFPFAGFWSKDEILLGAGENGYRVFMWVGLVGAFMTAAYMTRCIYLTFFGEYRGHGHPHESPAPITVPLVVLSVFSVAAGWLNLPKVELFTKWIEPPTVAGLVSHHEFSVADAVTSTVVVLAAIAVTGAYYFRHALHFNLVERNPVARGLYRFLERKYFLDDLYEGVIVASISGPVSRAAYWINQNVLDGVVNGAGISARAAAGFTYRYIDQGLIDGTVRGTGQASEGSGSVLRLIQTGRVQQYAAVLFGAVGILAAVLVFVNS